jgi:hypothetical protein
MKNLLVLGDSLTTQPGWANQIARDLDYSCINLAMRGCGNKTQIHRLNDFILADPSIEFDVIWQISYFGRTNIRLPKDHPDVLFKKYGESPIYESPYPNYFDSTKHMDILNTIWVKGFSNHYSNMNNDLSTLLASILFVKKLSNKCLIFFGDDVFLYNDISPHTVLKGQFTTFFQSNQINFIPFENNLVPWARRNNLSFKDDNRHPTEETYQKYATEILLPNFK